MEYTFFADITSWFFISVMLGLALQTIVSGILDWLNNRKINVRKFLGMLKETSDKIDTKVLNVRNMHKALAYKSTKGSFSDMVGSISSTTSMMVVILGLVPFSVALVSHWFPSLPMVWCWIISSMAISLIKTVLSIPASWYLTFRIEDKFGFKAKEYTLKDFFKDILKGAVIGLCMGIPLQMFINWCLQTFSGISILNILGFVLSLVVLGAIVKFLFVNVIMPLFNKFEPLQEGTLKDKLNRLCESCGIKASTISVMDASKRDNHGNAFVCGYFGKKKIVIYDTLLKTLTEDEIVGIVAHEIGHSKLHHILLNNLMMIVKTLFIVALVLVLIKIPEMYTAFGYSWVTAENIGDNLLIGFMLTLVVFGAFSWILTPLWSWISRKMEYAADRFAVEHSPNGISLANALVKLTASNLADAFPHPVYEFVHYSHPSILPRVKAIVKNATDRS